MVVIRTIEKNGKKRKVPINNRKKAGRVVDLDKVKPLKVEMEKKKPKATKTTGVKPGQLEKEAWGVLDQLSKVTDVDKLLLQMDKYSGLLGDYSTFNAMLIRAADPNATIVRSQSEWGYFGRKLKENARGLSILYPVGVPQKDMPGKVKDFIEKKRAEGLDDEAIDKLVSDKFNTQGGGVAYVFGTGKVYDISQTEPIPGKEKPVKDDVTTAYLYKTLKGIAKQHYTVKEENIAEARGYTAHSGTGTEIVVMKVPGENEEALHTLIHEMSHARLDHLDRKDAPYGIKEAEAELSTYLIGQHYGYNFKNDSATYMKVWLDNAKQDGHALSNENIDRAMNNARQIIQELDTKMETGK